MDRVNERMRLFWSRKWLKRGAEARGARLVSGPPTLARRINFPTFLSTFPAFLRAPESCLRPEHREIYDGASFAFPAFRESRVRLRAPSKRSRIPRWVGDCSFLDRIVAERISLPTTVPSHRFLQEMIPVVILSRCEIRKMLKSRLIIELFREFAKERRDQRGYNRENDNDNVRSSALRVVVVVGQHWSPYLVSETDVNFSYSPIHRTTPIPYNFSREYSLAWSNFLSKFPTFLQQQLATIFDRVAPSPCI